MGKIHYFDWAIFNSYVSLPEGTISLLIFLDQSSRFLWIWQLHPAAITLDPCGKPVTRLWNLHKDQNPTAFGNFLETLQLFQNAGETPPWCNCRANKKTQQNRINWWILYSYQPFWPFVDGYWWILYCSSPKWCFFVFSQIFLVFSSDVWSPFKRFHHVPPAPSTCFGWCTMIEARQRVRKRVSLSILTSGPLDLHGIFMSHWIVFSGKNLQEITISGGIYHGFRLRFSLKKDRFPGKIFTGNTKTVLVKTPFWMEDFPTNPLRLIPTNDMNCIKNIWEIVKKSWGHHGIKKIPQFLVKKHNSLHQNGMIFFKGNSMVVF